MPELALLKMFLRELMGVRSLNRSLHQISNMSVERQIDVMEHGGGAEGRTAAGYLFHSAHICRTIQGCNTVVDLGCGTGVQLLQVAQLNKEVQFIGVDKSKTMLDAAARSAVANQVENVDFLSEDFLDLRSVESASVDGVISTMTLHHLANVGELTRCFSEISRILRPGGVVYIEDFGRLKCESSVKYFVSRGDMGKPDGFSELYGASMRAAFLAEELRAIAGSVLPISVRVFNTFPIPFLVVAKTPDVGLAAGQKQKLAAGLNALDSLRRRDYQELALAFRLGGLSDGIPRA
jgi:ubiquinone/menaquinone biosynthesis C-methylase UbiE